VLRYTTLVSAQVHDTGQCSGTRHWSVLRYTTLVSAQVHDTGQCSGTRHWSVLRYTTLVNAPTDLAQHVASEAALAQRDCESRDVKCCDETDC